MILARVVGIARRKKREDEMIKLLPKGIFEMPYTLYTNHFQLY